MILTYTILYVMIDIHEHQDQRYTRGDNNGRDLYLLGVNVLVLVTLKSMRSAPCADDATDDVKISSE